MYQFLVRPSPKSLANLRPPWTSETARLARLKGLPTKTRILNERKAKHDKAWSRVTNARVADLERRLLAAEQRMEELAKLIPKTKRKPKPTVGDDIPTLAKPAQLDEPPVPVRQQPG